VQSPAGLTGVKSVAGFDCLLIAGAPVRDLLLRANYLFVTAMMASAPTREPVQQAAFR
jgi:hypothetical protein